MPEYRAEVVRLATMGDRTLSQVARDMGIGHQHADPVAGGALADVDAGQGKRGQLTTTERQAFNRVASSALSVPNR
jgi:hypothetical protein